MQDDLRRDCAELLRDCLALAPEGSADMHHKIMRARICGFLAVLDIPVNGGMLHEQTRSLAEPLRALPEPARP